MKRGSLEIVQGYLYILPALVILTIFAFIPIVFAFGLAFTDYNLSANAQFLALDNFIAALKDPLLGTSVLNTIIFTLTTVAIGVIISLLLALLVRVRCVLSTLSKAVFFVPVMISWVAASLVWKWLYHPTYGLINYYLSLLGMRSINWIGSPKYSLISLIIMSIWKELGYNMVLFIAALDTIPAEVTEAASIDGAGSIRGFFFVTLPLLRPMIAFIVCTTAIVGLQMFTQSYVITSGGPNYSSISVVHYIYMTAFRFLKMGYSSTVSLLLFAIILVVTLGQLRLLQEKK
jgi:multiple sugar transport system permease protein